MARTRAARWWLALTGVSQLGMAIALAASGPAWAAVVLTIMGAITIAGGVVQARGEH